MFNLTDYTAEELRVLADANGEMIFLLLGMEESYAKQSPEMRRLMADKRHQNAAKLKVHREHNVHLLTALQIVRDRETVNAN